MIDPKAALAGDRLGERRHGTLIQLLDVAAGGADQVVMMPWLAPDVRRDVPGPFEPLGEAGCDQAVE